MRLFGRLEARVEVNGGRLESLYALAAVHVIFLLEGSIAVGGSTSTGNL